MLIVAIGWIYVVGMVAIAEALSTQGTVLGALITLLLYGIIPLAIVLYILGTPARKRALQLRADRVAQSAPAGRASDAPDGAGHAATDAVAPEREKP